jgi:hypothetical protein
MEAASNPSCWEILGASVRGASHLRNGLPNQDAIAWFPQPPHDQSDVQAPEGVDGGSQSRQAQQDGERAQRSAMMAVSDGHGSNRCFRSQTGASLAVRCALDAMAQFQPAPEAGLDAVAQNARELLAPRIVDSWREAVQADLRINPLASKELELLENLDGAAARQSIESDPIVAYGATLLAILATDQFILYLQLGDGDIVSITDNGDARKPVPKDDRLLGNETTSLCLPHAWRDVRISVNRLNAEVPALVLASTDGYANSFRDETGFLKVGGDLLAMIRADGLDPIRPIWRAGSTKPRRPAAARHHPGPSLSCGYCLF